MDTETSLLSKPSAFVPIAMELTALGLVLGHAAVYGIVHQADEGTPAHLFQLLMVAQVPFVAFFILKWFPRAPKQALMVLALEAGIVALAFTGVYFLT